MSLDAQTGAEGDIIKVDTLGRSMPQVHDEAKRNGADASILDESQAANFVEKQIRQLLFNELKDASKLEEDQETCLDEGTCSWQTFADNDSEPESQVAGNERTEGFEKVEDVEERSKRWKYLDDDDDCGTLSDTSSASSRWDQQESHSTELDETISSAASLCSSPDSLDSIDSVADFYLPEETIIIFDWDDTICPTTAINEDYSLEVGCESLQALASEAKLTLEKAREVAAEVVIVTNATEGWVESSCENWLPGLLPILDMLEFASARSRWEPMGISTPTGWKAKAFEEVIRRFYSRYRRQSWKNVIVIGDASYEHEALNHVASLAPQGPAKRCRAKSIRFEPQPSVASLTRELQMLRDSFDDIVHVDDNVELSFRSETI